MDELSRALDLYNNVAETTRVPLSPLKELDIAHKLDCFGITDIRISTIVNIPHTVVELLSSLSTVQIQSSPFETISSCIKMPAINDLFTSVQDVLQVENDLSMVYVQKRFSDLINETVENVSLDEESQSKFKDILKKVSTLTFSQILSYIVSIITILEFVLSCVPDKQLEENNALQRQQIQESQRTNELLAEQNRLIDESISIDREKTEQLNKLVELHEQYIKFLLEIEEISTQVVDSAD